MTVRILADSASDLPLSFYKENSVTLFPLKVQLDNKEYEDLVSINPSQVYEGIAAGQLPKTSQVSPSKFENVFTEMAKNNEDGIYIAFSSELSGTYQTAMMIFEQVKETYPDFQLTIIDSKCASLGYGLAVMAAAEMANQGAKKDEIIQDVTFRCQHMEHLFTVEDLNYLAKGGRLSRASAFLGGLLNIKPLLNVEEGKLIPIEKIRGKKKVFKRIIEVMKERGEGLDKQIIGISHANDEDTALLMKSMIMEEFGTTNIYINTIGAAIGSHTGQSTVSIFFLNKLP